VDKTNKFVDYLAYVFDESNRYKREKYTGGRTLNGFAFDLECSIRVQYCVGSSYAEGWIGNLKFRIYICPLKGYRAYTCKGDEVIDEQDGKHDEGQTLGELSMFIQARLLDASRG